VIESAIPVFVTAYPGCQAVFFFDNTTGHSAYATNALRAGLMSLSTCGKQPAMSDGFFHTHDGRCSQKMSFAFDDTSVPRIWQGQLKGLKHILQERGLWRKGLLLRCKYTGLDKKRDDTIISDCLNLPQAQCYL
jgi:hypothetical protein